MAECSYARCVQQRRNIRRELQRWTKNMVHIVGLERIAEELMGRRKWKLYQESMSRNYLQPLNNNIKTHKEEYYKHHHQELSPSSPSLELNDTKKDITTSALITRDDGVEKDIADKQKENDVEKLVEEDEDRFKDWTPPTKCYFCVDGKLDSEHTTHGVLSPRQSDSDTTDSHSDNEVPPSLTPASTLVNTSTTTTGLLTTTNNHQNRHHHPPHRSSSNIGHPVAPANMTTIESVTSMAALAAVAALSGGSSPGTPAPHLPFYTPSMLSHNWYLANVARSFQEQRLATDNSTSNVEKNLGGGEQPLDLSKGANNGGSGGHVMGEKQTTNNNVRLPTLDTKHIFNSDFRAKPRMSAVAGRRTYTEDELQAALRDIQSGKLGTRRAAVIYGIPRSTLRNKVYKLALERERESHLNNTITTPPTTTTTTTGPTLKLEEEEVMDDDKELSGAEEEKEVEKALQAPLLCMEDIFRFSGMETPSPEALKSILLKNKEEGWPGLEHSEVGPYIQSILLASQNLLTHQKPVLDNALLNNLMPEFVKRMMNDEQMIKTHNNGDNEKLRPSPSNSVITKTDKSRSESDMETDETPSNVILKIPSFRPTSSKNGCGADLLFNKEPSGSVISPPITNSESGSPPILPGKGMTIKDVKDVIAQSISQKFQQNLEPRRPMIEMDFKRGGFTPPLTGGISVIKTQDLNRSFQSQQKQQQQQQQQQQNSSSTGGKGTRPKRGKYRNYDRDSLVEAVRAVQRGEMSVHRAGSYYGVPHSTLEYKVKERHLMRPRKRDPKPNPVDEKIASLKQSDIRTQQQQPPQPLQDKNKPLVMKPPQKFSPTSPNGIKLPIFEAGIPAPLTPFPFWHHPGFPPIPLEYSRNPASFQPNPEFFASQMMQKLQEESSRSLVGTTNQTTPNNAPTLAKNARQIAESLLDSGANGSFLDGIIRSSLESGVPAPEEKSPKEDKNVAPENMSNKALLDQLCRNSRLTPLSKPAMTEANSSGDEYYRQSPLNYAGASNSRDSQMMETSPRYEHSEPIELSNDSNESTTEKQRKDEPSTTPRIYLKKDLANPDNLQPEMLMRFRDIIPDMERNGIIGDVVTGSASDNDAPQD